MVAPELDDRENTCVPLQPSSSQSDASLVYLTPAAINSTVIVVPSVDSCHCSVGITSQPEKNVDVHTQLAGSVLVSVIANVPLNAAHVGVPSKLQLPVTPAIVTL